MALSAPARSPTSRPTSSVPRSTGPVDGQSAGDGDDLLGVVVAAVGREVDPVVVEAVAGAAGRGRGPVDDAHVRVRRGQGAQLVVVAAPRSRGRRSSSRRPRAARRRAHPSSGRARPLPIGPFVPRATTTTVAEAARGVQVGSPGEPVDERPGHDRVDAEPGAGQLAGRAEHHGVAERVAADWRRRRTDRRRGGGGGAVVVGASSARRRCRGRAGRRRPPWSTSSGRPSWTVVVVVVLRGRRPAAARRRAASSGRVGLGRGGERIAGERAPPRPGRRDLVRSVSDAVARLPVANTDDGDHRARRRRRRAAGSCRSPLRCSRRQSRPTVPRRTGSR